MAASSGDVAGVRGVENLRMRHVDYDAAIDAAHPTVRNKDICSSEPFWDSLRANTP